MRIALLTLALATLTAETASAQLAYTWPYSTSPYGSYGGRNGRTYSSRGYSSYYSPFGYSFYGPYYYGYGFGPYQPYDPYGEADIIRAQGEYNRNSAEAAIQSEAARKLRIDNNVKATEAYHARLAMGRQVTDGRLAEIRKTRDRYLENREPETPGRPTVLQLDQKTGKIYWPEVLLLTEYTPWRTQLDELFADRARRTADSRHALEIRQVTKALLQELKLAVRALAANDYLEARKFVESLGWESQFVAGE